MRRPPFIGVMGSGTCDRSSAAYQWALEVGRRIAEKGGIVVCGGRFGVMEAVARGAKEAGGSTIGILPERDRSGANAYIDIPIVTGMGDARNVINILTSDVIIAIDGGPGTLSEMALALKNRKRVIGLKTWRFDTPDYDTSSLYVEANTPAEAVDKAFEKALEH